MARKQKLKLKYKGTPEDRKFFIRFCGDELWAEDYPELIGLRAKFKDKLQGYAKVSWDKKGVIVDSDRTPYLYLKFDSPIRNGIGNSCITRQLIINKDSIKILV